MVSDIGNVKRLFHGTSQDPACMFGTYQSRPPCCGTECNVCSILKSSFQLAGRAGNGPGGQRWRSMGLPTHLRYGRGLYFSSVSSKSHDYNASSERLQNAPKGKKRRFRIMLICSVALGKQFRTQETRLPLDDVYPPIGYDSLEGVTSPGGLNYPECVVYDERQVIPQYVIVYSTHFNYPSHD